VPEPGLAGDDDATRKPLNLPRGQQENGPMRLMLSLLAVLSAALFAGAALYINVAEHPARLALDTRAAAAQWAPSYRRATWMQAPLALVSLVAGLAVWLMGDGAGWAIAAALIGAVVPFTFLGIMPTNHALLAPGRDLGSGETRALLERWGRLHAVRTALSLAAMILYLCLLLRT
jgi:Domain of unknown function (DUF1772)